MNLIKTLGIEDPEIVVKQDARKGKETSVSYKLVSSSKEKYIELFVLNSYLVQFIKQKKEDIQIEFIKLQRQYGFSDDDTNATELLNQTLKNLFFKYLSDEKIEKEVLEELERHKEIPTSFLIVENKSAFAVQRTDANNSSDYICVLHISKESNLLEKKKLLFMQVHNAIAKANVKNISQTIYVSRVDDSMLDILGVSTLGREIIKNRGGILYVQSAETHPKLRGMFEISNI